MTIKTSIGKITATPEVLNYLSILATEARDNFISKKHNGLATEAETVGHEIYKALEEIGLYK